MKLKISTLLIIIALLFAGYYFMNAPSQQPRINPTPEPVPLPYNDNEIVHDNDFQQGNETTPLTENFQVTPIEYTEAPVEHESYYNSNDLYEMAGNVRPDNAMIYE